jgi:hypothetical protein
MASGIQSIFICKNLVFLGILAAVKHWPNWSRHIHPTYVGTYESHMQVSCPLHLLARPTLLENRLTIPTLFADTGGAWCVHNKLACWRALCGNFKTTSQPMAWHSLRGINLACWRTLFEKFFIGKMSQFPLKYVTTWQEKPVEWLTYSPVTLRSSSQSKCSRYLVYVCGH